MDVDNLAGVEADGLADDGAPTLFKRFADIDSIDLEVSSEDPDEIVNCVKLLGKGWGGINLEDIKAPECFVIEQRLRDLISTSRNVVPGRAPHANAIGERRGNTEVIAQVETGGEQQ